MYLCLLVMLLFGIILTAILKILYNLEPTDVEKEMMESNPYKLLDKAEHNRKY